MEESTHQQVFGKIYTNHSWGPGDNPLGGGSGPGSRGTYKDWHHNVIKKHVCGLARTVVDIGCGDWELSKDIDWEEMGIHYIGIEVVPELVEHLQEQYGSEYVSFKHMDARCVKDLPKADAYIIKDVLQHWPNEDVMKFIEELRNTASIASRLLIINCSGQKHDFEDIQKPGQWRQLNAAKYPLKYFNPRIIGWHGSKQLSIIDLMRPLHRHQPISTYPRVLLAILARDKSKVLPIYLHCIEQLDYPKRRIGLWVRTNDNTDDTADQLKAWLKKWEGKYAEVFYDDSEIDESLKKYREHEWNAHRFDILSRLRQASMEAANTHDYDYYFVVDCDNFITSDTLRTMVDLDLPIVGPLLKIHPQTRPYANYHHKCTPNGYCSQNDPDYIRVFNQNVQGLIKVDVIHTTYLIKARYIPRLSYLPDGSGRHEYVLFSESARKKGVDQYLDNRKFYGMLTFTKEDYKSQQVCDIMRARDPGFTLRL